MPTTVVTGVDPFAAGQLGELTQIIPPEMVDAALAETRTTQRRVRVLPSRVVVYLLLAAGLFAELGYQQVWARLTSSVPAAACPGSSALAQARRRIGPAPLRALFELLAGDTGGAARWRGLHVCAIDGTTMVIPDSPANGGRYRHVKGTHGGSTYPIVRLVALVTCGTRTLCDAVFGPDTIGEIDYAAQLLRSIRPGMLILYDRGFDAADLMTAIHDTGADFLIRGQRTHKSPRYGSYPDGSWHTIIGGVTVRIIDAVITVNTTTADGHTIVGTGHYRLLTSLTDYRSYPAADLVELYHQRWEIEITYLELKSSILGGRVLRARTPSGITQEVYALLVVYQALRLAIAEATISTDTQPDRGSFTVALNTARDEIIKARNIIATTTSTVDLIGAIGAAVLAHLLGPRRNRRCPRVTKRAISKHRAKGTIDRTNYQTTYNLTIEQSAPDG